MLRREGVDHLTHLDVLVQDLPRHHIVKRNILMHKF